MTENRSRLLTVFDYLIVFPITFFIAATIVWWSTTTASEIMPSMRGWPIVIHLLLVLLVTSGLIKLLRRALASLEGRTQFSMKELCLAVLIISVLMATLGRKMHTSARQEIALLQMKLAGADVEAGTSFSKAALSVFNLFGHDPWTDFTSLDIRNDVGARELVARMGAFRELQHITFDDRVTDVGLAAAAEALNQSRRPAQVSLHASALTNEGLKSLSTANVYSLFINGCFNITDDGLQGFRKLRFLDVIGDVDGPTKRLALTDAVLAHVAQMKELEQLTIYGAPITDQGLKHLEGLTSLEKIQFRNTAITAEGIEQLRRALPNCSIVEMGSY